MDGHCRSTQHARQPDLCRCQHRDCRRQRRPEGLQDGGLCVTLPRLTFGPWLCGWPCSTPPHRSMRVPVKTLHMCYSPETARAPVISSLTSTPNAGSSRRTSGSGSTRMPMSAASSGCRSAAAAPT